MEKKPRIKRVIVKYQTKDQGANPLTKKGRKWIKKETDNCNEKELRKKLESQRFEDSTDELAYWDWLELHGYSDNEGNIIEPTQANPDNLSDEEITE